MARPMIPTIMYAGGGTTFSVVMIGFPTTKNKKGGIETPVKVRKSRKKVTFARLSRLSDSVTASLIPDT